MLLDYNLNWK